MKERGGSVNKSRWDAVHNLTRDIRICYTRWLRWGGSPSQTWRSQAEAALEQARAQARMLLKLLEEERDATRT